MDGRPAGRRRKRRIGIPVGRGVMLCRRKTSLDDEEETTVSDEERKQDRSGPSRRRRAVCLLSWQRRCGDSHEEETVEE